MLDPFRQIFDWLLNNHPYGLPLFITTCAATARILGLHIKYIPSLQAAVDCLVSTHNLSTAFPSKHEKDRLALLINKHENGWPSVVTNTLQKIEFIFGPDIFSSQAYSRCLAISIIYTPIFLIFSWLISGADIGKQWYALPDFSPLARIVLVLGISILAFVYFIGIIRAHASKANKLTSLVILFGTQHIFLIISTATIGSIGYATMKEGSNFALGATVIAWVVFSQIISSICSYRLSQKSHKGSSIFCTILALSNILELICIIYLFQDGAGKNEILQGLPISIILLATGLFLSSASMSYTVKNLGIGYGTAVNISLMIILAILTPNAAIELTQENHVAEDVINFSAILMGMLGISMLSIITTLTCKFISKAFLNLIQTRRIRGLVIGIISLAVILFIRTALRHEDTTPKPLGSVFFITNLFITLLLFPLWNALVDLASIATTTALLKRYATNPSSWWLMVIFDTLASATLTVLLPIGLLFIEGFSGLTINTATDIDNNINSLTGSVPLMIWTVSMAITNMAPTLLHLSLATSLGWAGWLTKDAWFFQNLTKLRLHKPINPQIINQNFYKSNQDFVISRPLSRPEAIKLVNAIKVDWIIAALLPISLLAALLLPIWNAVVNALVTH